MKLRTFDELIETDFRDDLSDPEFAMGYLQMCLDEAQAHDDTGIFLLALRNVAKAREAVSRAAEQAGKMQASSYELLSDTGKQEFAAVLHALPALGMKLQVVPDAPKPKRKKTVRSRKHASELVEV